MLPSHVVAAVVALSLGNALAVGASERPTACSAGACRAGSGGTRGTALLQVSGGVLRKIQGSLAHEEEGPAPKHDSSEKDVAQGGSIAGASHSGAEMAEVETADGTSCVTRYDPRASSFGYTTSPPGTKCIFGVDARDENSHCILDGGDYGSMGWCYTSSDRSSWGSCGDGCPLYGANKVLQERIQALENRLDEQAKDGIRDEIAAEDGEAAATAVESTTGAPARSAHAASPRGRAMPRSPIAPRTGRQPDALSSGLPRGDPKQNGAPTASATTATPSIDVINPSDIGSAGEAPGTDREAPPADAVSEPRENAIASAAVPPDAPINPSDIRSAGEVPSADREAPPADAVSGPRQNAPASVAAPPDVPINPSDIRSAGKAPSADRDAPPADTVSGPRQNAPASAAVPPDAPINPTEKAPSMDRDALPADAVSGPHQNAPASAAVPPDAATPPQPHQEPRSTMAPSAQDSDQADPRLGKPAVQKPSRDRDAFRATEVLGRQEFGSGKDAVDERRIETSQDYYDGQGSANAAEIAQPSGQEEDASEGLPVLSDNDTKAVTVEEMERDSAETWPEVTGEGPTDQEEAAPDSSGAPAAIPSAGNSSEGLPILSGNDTKAVTVEEMERDLAETWPEVTGE